MLPAGSFRDTANQPPNSQEYRHDSVLLMIIITDALSTIQDEPNDGL